MSTISFQPFTIHILCYTYYYVTHTIMLTHTLYTGLGTSPSSSSSSNGAQQYSDTPPLHPGGEVVLNVTPPSLLRRYVYLCM